MVKPGQSRLRRPHGRWSFVQLSPVILTVVIAGLAYSTPPDMAFSRILPAAPALAAAMWPVLPTVLLGTVCFLLMIGLSLVFPGLGAWYTCLLYTRDRSDSSGSSHSSRSGSSPTRRRRWS